MYLITIIFRSRVRRRICVCRHPGELPVPFLQERHRRWSCSRCGGRLVGRSARCQPCVADEIAAAYQAARAAQPGCPAD